MIPRPHTSKLFPYTTLFRSKKLEKNNWGSGRIKIPSSHGHGVITAGDNNNAINNNEAKRDRKSTRLNSSHVAISYAVFCLKKKKLRLSIQNVRNICTR